MDLSIGVTCWNAQDSILIALESIRHITDKNLSYEVIIVDDASNDNSALIIEEYITLHSLSNFFLVKSPVNRGVASARNEIINHAKGVFLAFLDDDDEWLPIRYSAQKKALLMAEEKYRHVLCYGGRSQKSKAGYLGHKKALGYPEMVSGKLVKKFFVSGDKQNVDSFNPPGTCVLFTRLSNLKKLNGFDESFKRMEDVDLVIRHCDSGGVCIGTNEEVIIQNITYSKDKGFEQELYYRKKLIKKYIPSNSLGYLYSYVQMHKSLAYKQGKYFKAKAFMFISLFLSLNNFKFNVNKILKSLRND
ncbi:glycosyltransferase family 2 protein [Pseudoalteromonas sp. NZS11]|uniref:glycosyltransferase family 2 protein n=1 Tax=Pseudoalteromonas sp. NZS11 TaxID=2792049 RepID=UPI0018CE8F06|nr:glycosyltransferase family 2 protein [Pseudoalteromonas sp. NZS11]MBH0080946.1 glycosyltransferase family 2 protein [Pseudoalteromonas sp. NZS11]